MTERLQFEADFTLRDQIRARAEHPECADRTFLMQHDRSWTYRQFRDESTRVAHFLLARLGAIDDGRPGHVAMMLDNHLELVSLFVVPVLYCGYMELKLQLAPAAEPVRGRGSEARPATLPS